MLEIFGKRLETTVLELTLKSTWLKACGYFGLSSPSLATYSKGLGPPRIFVLPTYLLTNQFAMMKQHKFLPHLPFCWFLGIGFFSHETIYHLSLCVQRNAWVILFFPWAKCLSFWHDKGLRLCWKYLAKGLRHATAVSHPYQLYFLGGKCGGLVDRKKWFVCYLV